jgi:sRNA-binding protein
MNANQIIGLLVERFPAAFSTYQYRRRPLKVGIHHDIIAALGDEVDPKALSIALAIYTGADGYLHAMKKAGARRIDLRGGDAGEVLDDQREHARLSLEKRRKKAAPPAQATAGPNGPPSSGKANDGKGTKAPAGPNGPPPAPPPAWPRRLSLADLKQAAQARKAAPAV